MVYRKVDGVDAIDEYSRRLVDALRARDIAVGYVADGMPPARQTADPAWLLLQYNPFSYGRRGIAPGLIGEVRAFRRRTGAPVAVCVHEAGAEAGERGRARWRSAVIGTYQRAQLAVLLSAADVVMAATQALARKIGHGAIHVPVGSNVPALPIERGDARQRLDLGDELVVALFGGGHPSRALEYAAAAIELLATARAPRPVRVLNLGVGAPVPALSREIAVRSPGHLSAADVSVHLRAADLLLLPFTDGVSTRRTTLMAGLAHGLAVVGLRGGGTDDVLADSRDALTLTPVGDVDAFARAAVRLADDPDRLRRSGEAGLALYATHFDWPVTARRVAAAMGIEPAQAAGRRSTTTA